MQANMIVCEHVHDMHVQAGQCHTFEFNDI
jgi:hypothetical protein